MTVVAIQILVNGLIAGSLYALVACGLSLLYNVEKFTNFAHGATVVISAYATYFFSDIIKLPFVLAALLGIIIAVASAVVVDMAVFKTQRKRKFSMGIMLVTSLAILIFVSNLILLLFESKTFEFALSKSATVYDNGLFRITGVQVIMLFMAISLLVLFWLLMKKTKLGKAMRATADNRDVAQIVGINAEQVYLFTTIIAACTAGIAGILFALDTNLFPTMGTNIMATTFAAAVIGGYNSVPGAVLGSFFIGIVENIVGWYLPTGYRTAIVFGIVFLFLIFRPRGLVGKVYER